MTQPLKQPQIGCGGTNLKWNIIAQATANVPTGSQKQRRSTGESDASRKSGVPPVSSLATPSSEHLATKVSVEASAIKHDAASSSPEAGQRANYLVDWRTVGGPVSSTLGDKEALPTKCTVERTSTASLTGYNPASAQLPMSLNEAIGLDDPEELAEIFRRTSISAPPQAAAPQFPSPPSRQVPQTTSAAMNYGYSTVNPFPEYYPREYVPRRPSYVVEPEQEL